MLKGYCLKNSLPVPRLGDTEAALMEREYRAELNRQGAQADRYTVIRGEKGKNASDNMHETKPTLISVRVHVQR